MTALRPGTTVWRIGRLNHALRCIVRTKPTAGLVGIASSRFSRSAMVVDEADVFPDREACR